VPLSRHLTPPLTTVRAPIEQAGRVAAQQLVKLIQGREADLLTLLSTELMIRKSCGCSLQK
jgi:DNA-binding LacI/PurR family transcriptional regulator